MTKVLELIGDLTDLEREVRRRCGQNIQPLNVEKMTLGVAAEKVRDAMLPVFTKTLRDTLEAHEVLAGDRIGGGSDPDDWDAELDDQVLQAMSPWQDVIGAGFLGGASVDAQLQNDGEIERLAREFAAQYGSELVNFNKDDVKGYVQITAAATPDAVDIHQAKGVVAVVISGKLREGIDAFELIEEMDLASQEDDILAMGAIERLAPNYANKEQIRRDFRAVRLALGKDWDDQMIRQAGGAPVEAPAAPEPAKKTRRKKGDPVQPEPLVNVGGAKVPPAYMVPGEKELSDEDAAFLAELEGSAADPTPPAPAPVVAAAGPASVPISAPASATEITPEQAKEIVTTCKDTLPLSEKALAELFGFSRSTLNNIASGKSQLHIDPLMRQRVRDYVLNQIERLNHIGGML